MTQPIVRLVDGRAVGYEVLARSKSLAHLRPDEWLERAERAGLRLDAELACLQAAAALGAPPDGARLFLNASAGLLLDPRLDGLLPSFPPHVFEVTEHERIADYATLTERLRTLASHGSLVAVDDVGAGYANMAHVLRLSPQYIKIDRGLVSGLHTDRDRRALISALVAFAVACGAQTIAEGVEEPAELQALAELGVDLVQGYLLARPAPGWPEPVRGHLPQAGDASALPPLAGRLERAADLASLAELAATWLYEEYRLMPSVYVERAGSLRCVARRGQWIVHDGMAPGVGITGRAFAQDTELWVPDVDADPLYRPAIPGVRSELCIPLHSGGRAIGVLNVESFSELSSVERTATREVARLLEERLQALEPAATRRSALRELGRVASSVADAADVAELTARAVQGAVAVSGLTSAALWWCTDGTGVGARLAAGAGEAADVFGGFDADTVQRLFGFADGVTSCHTGGGPRDLAASFLGRSMDAVARAMLIVPLRTRGRTVGLLLATSSGSSDISGEAVEATELLGLHVATAAAHLPQR